MASTKKFFEVLNSIPEDTKREVKFTMDVLDRIHELLESKFQGKQSLLAEKLGISEAAVSKMINGIQNFKFKTIFRLEAAFGEPILAVCTSSEEANFEQVKCHYNHTRVDLAVNKSGKLLQEFKTASVPVEKAAIKPYDTFKSA